MKDRLKLTIYLASAIEHNPIVNKGEKEDWKAIVKRELSRPDIGIYDPVDMEAIKTGKTADEIRNYVNGLKRSGSWDHFHKVLSKIWWGDVSDATHRVEIMTLLRSRFLIDGNKREDLPYWGDYEAVLRSNFIIAYIEKNVKTVGTICEIHTCYLFQIPVYLILPDQTKTEANSTLIDLVIKSGGEIFYSVNDCIKYIKKVYNL